MKMIHLYIVVDDDHADSVENFITQTLDNNSEVQHWDITDIEHGMADEEAAE
jgi:translation elongation factor EF-1beta